MMLKLAEYCWCFKALSYRWAKSAFGSRTRASEGATGSAV